MVAVINGNADARHRFYVEGETERIPASLELAKAEDRELISDIQKIEASLSTALTEGADSVWRRRALDARRHMNDRRRFLRDWISEAEKRDRQFVKARVDLDEIYTTTLLREAAKRIGYLESIYMASVELFENDTPEVRSEWERRLRTAMEHLNVRGPS